MGMRIIDITGDHLVKIAGFCVLFLGLKIAVEHGFDGFLVTMFCSIVAFAIGVKINFGKNGGVNYTPAGILPAPGVYKGEAKSRTASDDGDNERSYGFQAVLNSGDGRVQGRRTDSGQIIKNN